MWKISARILALPLAEYLFLRLWIRQVLELRPGWGKLLVDTDLFLSIPLAIAAMAWILAQSDSSVVGFSRRRTFVHLGFLAAFITLNLFLSSRAFDWAHWMWVWWFACLGSFVSAALVWVSPWLLWNHPHRLPLALAFLLGVITVVLKHVPVGWTQSLDHFGNDSACYLAKHAFGLNPSCYWDCVSQYFIVQGQQFAVRIGSGCRGYDGGIAFLSMTLIYFSVKQASRRLSSWMVSLIFCFGFLVVLLLNPLRIAGLYALGEYVSENYGYPFAKYWVGEIFHLHLGLVLSVAVFGMCVWLLGVMPVLLSTRHLRAERT